MDKNENGYELTKSQVFSPLAKNDARVSLSEIQNNQRIEK